jgi:hypothetical protein
MSLNIKFACFKTFLKNSKSHYKFLNLKIPLDYLMSYFWFTKSLYIWERQKRSLQLAHELQSLHVHLIIVWFVTASRLAWQNMPNKLLFLRTFAAYFYNSFPCFSSAASMLLFSRENSLCRFFLKLLNKHQKNITLQLFQQKKYQGAYIFQWKKLHVFTVTAAILIPKGPYG